MHVICADDHVGDLYRRAHEALEKYLCTRQIEDAALGMVRHYKRRRQQQYHDYLRQYMALTKHPDFDDSYKLKLQERHRETHTFEQHSPKRADNNSCLPTLVAGTD